MGADGGDVDGDDGACGGVVVVPAVAITAQVALTQDEHRSHRSKK